MTYKITQNGVFDGVSHIPRDMLNGAYIKFLKQVSIEGMSIVEGPDVVAPSYVELRQDAYPSIPDQLDKIYHSGVAAWKTQIKAIKDANPKTITGGTTIGDVPDWVQTDIDAYVYERQMRDYMNAVKRLDQYILSEGVPAVTEPIVVRVETNINEDTRELETTEITEGERILKKAILPLEENVEVTTVDESTDEVTTSTVRNPLIVKDEEERAAAQAVVDATPQQVKDDYASA